MRMHVPVRRGGGGGWGSPRSTAPYQTDEPLPTDTSPTSDAEGATKAALSTAGLRLNRFSSVRCLHTVRRSGTGSGPGMRVPLVSRCVRIGPQLSQWALQERQTGAEAGCTFGASDV